MKLIDIGKCPFCGADLEWGYLNAPGGLWWDTKKHTLIGGGSMRLAGQWQWTIKNIPSLRCARCNVFVFSGSPQISPQDTLKVCSKCGCDIPVDEEKCEFCGAPQPDMR